MDASRCVVIEFDGANQETLLKYLSKNDLSYNWIVTAFDEIRVCIWWTKNVEFSITPLRSFLKRFKNKMPLDSYLKISRKMSTQEGVRKVYGGNGPAMLTLDALQRSCIYYLTRPVCEHVIGLQLQEPNNEQPGNFFEPHNIEPTPLRVGDPPVADKDREFKLDISSKIDLLLKITARIATQIKNLKKIPIQPDPIEVMEDTTSSVITHADVPLQPMQPEVIEVMDEPAPKPAPKFNLSKMYCNRDPITGECDGDPRGHFHPF